MKTLHTVLTIALVVGFTTPAQATDQRKLTYSGRILKSDGTAVNATTTFKLDITDTAGTCILWEESITAPVSSGAFTLQLGSTTPVFDGGGAGSLDKIFAQGKSISCKGGGTVTPVVTDDRNLAVSFNDGTGWQSLTSQIAIKTVPFALSASGISGIPVDVSSLADTYVLKYSSASNTWVAAAAATGGGTVTGVTAGTGISMSGTATAPVVNLTTPVSVTNGGTGVNSASATNGQLLIGNGSGFSLANLTAGTGVTITNAAGGITIAASGGSVTSVTSANSDISVTNTTSTPVLTLNSGTGANNILKLNASSQIPAVDGSLVTKLNASAINSGTVPAIYGGTGFTSYTTGDLIYASSSSALAKLSDVAAGSALVSGGVGVAPSYSNIIGGVTHSSGNLTTASGGISVSAASGSVTTVGGTIGASSTTINGGGTGGGISLVPGTLGINVSGWTTAGYVKNDTSGNLTGGNTMGSSDITTGLGYTPVNKAGDTMTGTLTVSGGAIISASASGSSASLNFATSNVQMTSSTATTINLCGLKDGGAYTLVMTGIAAATTVTITGYTSTTCTGSPAQVDLGAGAATFVTSGSTNILSFVFFSSRGANGTVYGVPATNYTY